jgi:ribosomal protein S18 acetylase RimI-like enzyme
VLPEHSRTGIARRPIHAALPELRRHGVRTLDAWTPEDPAATAWYQRHGFHERFRYLHVYKDWEEDDTGSTSPDGLRPFACSPMHLSREKPCYAPGSAGFMCVGRPR